MSRIDLRRAFKQLFRSISQLRLLATVVDDLVFIDATMSMGLRNTCKFFEEDFMKAFIKGLVYHHPSLFSDDWVIWWTIISTTSSFSLVPSIRIHYRSSSRNIRPISWELS